MKLTNNNIVRILPSQFCIEEDWCLEENDKIDQVGINIWYIVGDLVMNQIATIQYTNILDNIYDTI